MCRCDLLLELTWKGWYQTDLRSYLSVDGAEILTGFDGKSLLWSREDFDREFATVLVQDFADKIGRSVPYRWLKGYLDNPGSVRFGGGNYLSFDLEGNSYGIFGKVNDPYLPYCPEDVVKDCLMLLFEAEKVSAT